MSLVLTGLLIVQEAAPFDAKAEVLRAIERLAAAQSYAYKSKVEYATQGYFGAGKDLQGPIEAEGKFDAKAGLVGTSNGFKFARRGERLVTADGAGFWATPGSRAPDLRDMRTQAGPGMDAPHKGLAGFGKKIASAAAADDTERAGDAECVVVNVELTAKAAEALIQAAAVEPLPPSGGGGPALQYSGKARFWLDDDGKVRRVETVAEVAVKLGAQRYSMTRRQKTDFSGFDATTVELPARAEEALQKAAGSKDR